MLILAIVLFAIVFVLGFMVYRLWALYFELLEYHQRFLEKTNDVLIETEKYLEIPIFEFTPEVRAWVNLVKDFRNSMRDALRGFEVILELEEEEKEV